MRRPVHHCRRAKPIQIRDLINMIPPTPIADALNSPCKTRKRRESPYNPRSETTPIEAMVVPVSTVAISQIQITLMIPSPANEEIVTDYNPSHRRKKN